MRKRYIAVGNKWVPIEEYQALEPSGPMIMPDIQPYQSMVDGSIINSRSRHREHLRQHNCVEVGNDSSLYRPRKPLAAPPGLKDHIIRATNEVEQKLRRK